MTFQDASGHGLARLRSCLPAVLASLAMGCMAMSMWTIFSNQETVAKKQVQQEYLDETMILIPEEAIATDSVRVQEVSDAYVGILTTLAVVGAVSLVLLVLAVLRDHLLRPALWGVGVTIAARLALLYLSLEIAPVVLEAAASVFWAAAFLLLLWQWKRHRSGRDQLIESSPTDVPTGTA